MNENALGDVNVLNNISKVCRLCLKFGEMKSLFDFQGVLQIINLQVYYQRIISYLNKQVYILD